MRRMPGKQELTRMYREYNQEFFEGKLPDASKGVIEFNPRLTAIAGRCLINRITKEWKIQFSPHYFRQFQGEAFDRELKAVFLHEMIHLRFPGHGPLFYNRMKRINQQIGTELVTRHSKFRATPKEIKWMYKCACMEHQMTRKLKDYQKCLCKKCKGHLLEEIKVD